MVSLGLAVVSFAATNYLVDPFQYFRKAAPPRFSVTMLRHQMPGVIRNYPFDSIVVGNSVGSNLRPLMFSAYEPQITVQNLILFGATLKEATEVVKLALKMEWAPLGGQI